MERLSEERSNQVVVQCKTVAGDDIPAIQAYVDRGWPCASREAQ
jgi:hypothetical protein